MNQEDYIVPKHVLLEFHNLNEQQLQSLYNFLNFDLDTLTRVLLRISNSEQIDQLIEEIKNNKYREDLLKIMQYGDLKLLKNYLKKRIPFEDISNYLLKLNIEEVKQQLQQEEVQERPIVIQNSILLNQAKIILDHIMDFLDPPSLHQTRLVCFKLNEYFQDPIRSDKFYEKFCRALFAQKIYVQQIQSPFEQVRAYINSNLNIYAQQLQLINSINNNASETIWQNWGNVQEQLLTYNDIKQNYKCHKEMFEQYLRINYCGVYAMKEYYVKYGEAQFRQTSAPCLRVEYFRYVRFWRDGTFTMFISTKKLPKQKLLEYFRFPEYQSIKQKDIKQSLDDSFLRGEYRIINDEVYAISARQSTTFMYIYKIKTYKNKHPGNVLMVLSGQMHTLGDNYRQDIIDPQKRSHYIYKHIEEFRNDFKEQEGLWKNIVY